MLVNLELRTPVHNVLNRNSVWESTNEEEEIPQHPKTIPADQTNVATTQRRY